MRFLFACCLVASVSAFLAAPVAPGRGALALRAASPALPILLVESDEPVHVANDAADPEAMQDTAAVSNEVVPPKDAEAEIKDDIISTFKPAAPFVAVAAAGFLLANTVFAPPPPPKRPPVPVVASKPQSKKASKTSSKQAAKPDTKKAAKSDKKAASKQSVSKPAPKVSAQASPIADGGSFVVSALGIAAVASVADTTVIGASKSSSFSGGKKRAAVRTAASRTVRPKPTARPSVSSAGPARRAPVRAKKGAIRKGGRASTKKLVAIAAAKK